MEEILASIRRIIADDDSLPGARREREDRRRREEEEAAAPAPITAAQIAYPAPVLEPAPQPEPVVERPQPAPVADIRQLRLNRAPELVVEEPQTPVEEEFEDDSELSEALVAAAPVNDYEPESAPLVSSDAASSIASHFQALAASMIINDSGLLQKYAQEMLRPMLKQWLDDNLPVIVERLVRAEIERVARGGRR